MRLRCPPRPIMLGHPWPLQPTLLLHLPLPAASATALAATAAAVRSAGGSASLPPPRQLRLRLSGRQSGHVARDTRRLRGGGDGRRPLPFPRHHHVLARLQLRVGLSLLHHLRPPLQLECQLGCVPGPQRATHRAPAAHRTASDRGARRPRPHWIRLRVPSRPFGHDPPDGRLVRVCGAARAHLPPSGHHHVLALLQPRVGVHGCTDPLLCWLLLAVGCCWPLRLLQGAGGCC
jgi:hypothetical protein